MGRDSPLAELEAALEQAVAGDGAAVGVAAEAGVGKSRLCQEFAQRCRERGIAVYEAQCQAHGRALPLLPVLQMFRAYFGIEPGDPEDAARRAVSERLLSIEPGFETDLGLVFDFLGLPDPERPTEQMSPEARQRRILGVITRIVRSRSREETVVNLIEDLHWIDPASEAFLAALVEAVPGTGSLVLANFRPEYSADWMRRTYYRRLPLPPLSGEALSELLAGLLAGDPSLDGLVELIGERTGGNPFFVEESVRELAESGALEGERGAYRLLRQIDELALPATVQTVLAARIDRLSEPAKAGLQAAAAIGREFRRDVLALTLAVGEGALEASLRELLDGEFVHEHEPYPEPVYAFAHPLTREVAYGSQLAAARARTHAAIAAALQRTEAERLDEQAGLIAQHLELAGEAMDAASWSLRAAGWAGFRDPTAAGEHCQRVRGLDDRLPDGAAADELRLAARIILLGLEGRLGADLPRAREVFAEAMATAARLGDHATPALLCVLLGWSEATSGGSVTEFVRLAEEAKRCAEGSEDPRAIAALAGVMYAFWLAGRHGEALASVEPAVALTSADHEFGSGFWTANLHAWVTTHRDLPLAWLGRLSEARCALADGAELARRCDREVLGWSHNHHACMTSLGSDEPGTETPARAREALEIAEELGGAFSIVAARVWVGIARVVIADHAEGAHVLTEALEMIASGGVGLEFEPWARGWLGRALAGLGRSDAAVEEGERAVRVCDERGVGAGSPMVRHLLAQTLVERAAPGDLDRAGALLGEAEAIARELGQRPDLAKALLVRSRLAQRLGDAAARDSALAASEALAREMDARGLLAELEAERAAVG